MPPNFTAVAPVKLVPVMVTDVPPDPGPLAGDTARHRWPKVTKLIGRARRADASRRRDGDVNRTSRMRRRRRRDRSCADHRHAGRAVPPNVTAVAPVKLVPVMVTDVPPAAGPEFGLTLVTVGAAT